MRNIATTLLLPPALRTGLLLAPAITAMLAPPLAHAYEPRALGSCSQITFASDPDVVIHTAEMEGFDLAESFQVLDAMVDIHAAFEEIGGTSIAVGDVSLSTDPFSYQTWFNDPTPTIHVGFTSDPTADPGSTFWNADASCDILEAHIQLQNPSVFDWAFMDPETAGEPYYLAGRTGPEGRYFRISYMHEFLHAFGLAHSNDGYSMLNYGERPWANRADGAEIMPLPDDVEGIRDLYPGGADRLEVALLNTWYEPVVGSTQAYPAADHEFLCSPSAGGDWTDRFDAFCSEDEETEVCPGDVLRTRMAVANYSTEGVDVNLRLWFSTDDQWDGQSGGDVRASELHEVALGANGSSQQGRVYTVPQLAYDREYFVLGRARATGQQSGGVVQDWIPLRGTIRTKPLRECLTAIPL